MLVSIMLGMLAVIGCLTLVSQRKSHAVALLQPLMKPAVFEEVPMQSLVYIPRPAANPGDYSEFRNMCISACESSMIYDTTEKCGAAALGGHWVTFAPPLCTQTRTSTDSSSWRRLHMLTPAEWIPARVRSA